MAVFNFSVQQFFDAHYYGVGWQGPQATRKDTVGYAMEHEY